jgi:hypothetical protein
MRAHFLLLVHFIEIVSLLLHLVSQPVYAESVPSKWRVRIAGGGGGGGGDSGESFSPRVHCYYCGAPAVDQSATDVIGGERGGVWARVAVLHLLLRLAAVFFAIAVIVTLLSSISPTTTSTSIDSVKTYVGDFMAAVVSQVKARWSD